MSISRVYTSFTRNEIRQLFQTAKRAVKELELTILLAPKQGPTGRLLVVTPRIIGNAPARNRLRRQCKSIFYEERLFDRGFDCAIITRPGVTSFEFSLLKTILVKAFEQISKQEPK